jgi:hypothetical protein
LRLAVGGFVFIREVGAVLGAVFGLAIEAAVPIALAGVAIDPEWVTGKGFGALVEAGETAAVVDANFSTAVTPTVRSPAAPPSASGVPAAPPASSPPVG